MRSPNDERDVRSTSHALEMTAISFGVEAETTLEKRIFFLFSLSLAWIRLWTDSGSPDLLVVVVVVIVRANVSYEGGS